MKSGRKTPKKSKRREMCNRMMREEVYWMQIKMRAHGQWIVHI